jgi:transposase
MQPRTTTNHPTLERVKTPKMPRPTGKKDLTEIEIGQIIGLRIARTSFRDIAEIVQCSQGTAKNHFYRWKQDSANPRKRPGRPPKISDRERRRLIREAREHRNMPLKDITNFVVPQLSVSTVKRILAKEHIKKWIAAERPELTDDHAHQRLEWALLHKDWTPEQWARVIWSDECSVEKSKDPRQVWVFRTPGEKWIKECINPKLKSGSTKLMVWGCFAGRRKGTFAICPKKMNGFAYKTILEENLPQFCEELYQIFGEEAIFMQDNAPVHTAHLVKDWLTKELYVVMDWPPYSPDLNPIEHIWRELKIGLQVAYPDIKYTKGGPDKVRAALAEALPQVWDSLSEDKFWTLCSSMPERCAAVIKAEGWYTKY